MKQVDKKHYDFNKYLKKGRWNSIWNQIDEVLKTNPKKVLEIGPGPGIFKSVLLSEGIEVKTVDIDPELNPDFVASATDLPFDSNSYDCVVAFQMLEHIPYKDALKAFNEFTRVAKKNVIISLPNAKVLWPVSIYIPRKGDITFNFPKPKIKTTEQVFDGQHYWEINKKGYPLKKIINDFKNSNLLLRNTYRVKENLYHQFFIFEKVKIK